MKRIFITLLLVFAVTMSVKSQVVFVENFSYPVGDSIGAHGWNGFSSSLNPIFVVSPGLTYAGYGNSNIGNACYINKTGEDSYKDATAADSVGSYYLSFMLKVDTARTGDYFIALLPAANNTNYNLRVKITANGTGFYSLGLGKGSAGDTVSNMGVTFPIGATILVVGKYTFVSGTNNDQLALYAFTSGVPATEPGTPLVSTPTGGSADLANVGRVGLRQGTAAAAPSLVVDGIKVSKSWSQIITNVTTVSSVADNFSLSQNYPNPFNPSTTIKFSLPSSGMTSLKVYDAMGKEVSSLVNGNLSAGQYSAQFNGASLASGMYFYKLEFTGIDGKTVSEQKKLMLVK